MKIILLSNQHFKNAFEKLGHEVKLITGAEAEKYDVSKADADLIIVHESLGMRHIPHGIEKVCAPTVFYSIDVHLNLYWHREYAQLFDYVFVTQKNYLDQLKHNNAFWLPASIIPEVFHDRHLDRVHDIVFVGTIDSNRSKRMNIIQELQKRFDLKLFGTDPQMRISHAEMAKIYSQAKMVLNESILGEITFRTFEAMACGALLITERIDNGLPDLFNDGVDLVMYGVHDLINKVHYYLDHSDERMRIAACGIENIMHNHTAYTRAETMMRIVTENGLRKQNVRRNTMYTYYGKALYYTGVRFPRYGPRRLTRAVIMLRKAIVYDADACEPYIYLALTYAAMKKHDKALYVLRDCRRIYGDSFAVLAVLACLELKAGNTHDALSYLNMLYPGKTVTADTFYLCLGNSYEERGRYIDIGLIKYDDIPVCAIDCYLKDMSCSGHMAASSLYFKLGFYQESAAMLANISRYLQGNSAVNYMLGYSYLHIYALSAALGCLSRVFTIKKIHEEMLLPDYIKGLISAEICLNKGEYRNAVKLYSDLTCDEAYLKLGFTYLQLDECGKACRYCKLACEKRPYDHEAFTLWGICCLKCGIPEMAVEKFEKSLSLKDNKDAKKFLEKLKQKE